METKKLTMKRAVAEEGKWILWLAGKELESYSSTESIDFSKLMRELMDDDLKSKYQLIVDFDDPAPHETRLINVIKKILSKHEKSVDQYQLFITEQLKTITGAGGPQ